MLNDWCASPAGVRSSISTANRADLPGLQTSSRSSCVVHTLVQQQQCFWSVELGENSQPFVMIQQVCDTCRSGGPAHCWTSKRCSKMCPVPPLDMPLFSSLSLALPLQPFPHSLSLLNPSLYPGCAVACLPDYCNWGPRPDNSWGFPSSQNHPPGWNSPTGWNSGFHLSFSSYPLSSPDYCHLPATMVQGSRAGLPASNVRTQVISRNIVQSWRQRLMFTQGCGGLPTGTCLVVQGQKHRVKVVVSASGKR